MTIESVKAASDIAAPLDGQITEVNPAIVANPALVNEDPMEDGWFFKMTLEDPSEFDGLMDEEAYREYIAYVRGVRGCVDRFRDIGNCAARHAR